MDMILINGEVVSLDRSNGVYQAVGVTRGLISALGSSEELRKSATPDTAVVDLRGKVVFPGFIDSHNHLMLYGYLLSGIDCASPPNRDIGDVLARVKAAADKAGPGGWIKGGGYNELKLKERRHITRWELDSVSPRNPVVIYHTSYHACLLNSLALAKFGIDDNTPDPPGGQIVREQGRPVGLLYESASMRVMQEHWKAELESGNAEDGVRMCSQASRRYAEAGITTAHDALVTPFSLRAYQDALARDELYVRVYTMNLHDTAEPLLEAGIKFRFGSDMLRIGPIKIFYDGGMTSRTAYVSEPYKIEPYGTGIQLLDKETLREKIKRYNGLGYQIAVHAQGDAAIRDTLQCFRAAMGAGSGNPLRHRIEHCGAVFDDLIPLCKELGILVSSQPGFISDLGDGFMDSFGHPKSDKLYPFRTLLEEGILVGGASDSPVTSHNPLIGLRDAILRKTPSGRVMGVEQRLSIEQALRMYTNAAARLSFDEDVKGSIELGKLADFTILSENPMKVAPERIADIRVDMTMVGGRVTHRHPDSGL